jgi:hypothetical protein
MSIFGKLLKTTFDVVTAPVAVVKDFATMGGAVNGRRQTYTGEKLEQLADDAKEIRDELDDL